MLIMSLEILHLRSRVLFEQKVAARTIVSQSVSSALG